MERKIGMSESNIKSNTKSLKANLIINREIGNECILVSKLNYGHSVCTIRKCLLYSVLSSKSKEDTLNTKTQYWFGQNKMYNKEIVPF